VNPIAIRLEARRSAAVDLEALAAAAREFSSEHEFDRLLGPARRSAGRPSGPREAGGQVMIEYGLLLMLLGTLAFTVCTFLGARLLAVFSAISVALA
jgi:Flp pilus assembly pilin Flp